ncbi:MAG: pyridoxal phosphate-dependent aminotransferase family protein [Alphaproteobacteria bacterium]|nr:pyridoxal phosphate-dependent aminotransferase family protein [Alphaproteobacteria bacterium]
MNRADYLNQFNFDKSLAEEVGFNPYFQSIDSGMGAHVQLQGKSLINLGTNDYLGLSNKPEIKAAARAAMEEFGVSMCGTPIVIGQSALNRELETELARFLKQDDALVYPSCYQCNMSIFSVLATEDDVILFDKNVHSSMMNGISLTKAKWRTFPHNNWQRLEDLLKITQDRRMRFIVFEGLYSTGGDYPDLSKIIKLAKKYNAFTIIDDSHGVGILGDTGRGVVELYDAFKEIDLITFSLGKAIGTFGGALAGRGQIVDFFRYSSSMYFYSTALPPGIAGATIKALKYIDQAQEERGRIKKYANKMYEALKEMGYTLSESEHPLFSVISKTSQETFKLTKQLFERGVYVVPFIPPSVPKNSPRIRLTFNAYLAESDVNQAISVFKEIKEECPDII